MTAHPTIPRAGRPVAVRAGAAMLAAVALAASTGAAQQPYPTSPPPPAPLQPPAFPPFQEATLSNGLQLVLVERHTQPVLSLSLAMPAGSAYDPAGKEGLADMVAGLLTKGAASRSAEQIAGTIEGVGGSLAAGAGADFMTARTDVLASDAPLAFELLSDVVRRPTFPQAEVELARTQTLSGLQLQETQPASLATRFFNENLYGRHPYARSATPASVRGFTRADLVAYQQARLRPGGSLLVIAGDITLARARALAEQAFGSWKGTAPTVAAFPAPPKRGKTEIVLVHRPGSVQSNIVVGNVALGPADPLRYATTVANQVLGGGSDARLFLILREQKGWTYGAYSNLSRPRGPGAFQATAEVRTPVTDSALTEMLAQLRRLRGEPVSAQELAAAKGSLVGRFPLTIETAQQIAGAVSQAKLLGLGTSYLRDYRTRLSAITTDDVLKAAKVAIRPDSALIVVVGDGARLYDDLKQIAPVRIVNAQGDVLSPDDLVAKAAGVALDPRLIVPGVDSFAVLVQGRPFGYARTEIQRTPQGVVITERQEIGPIISQTTTTTLTDRLSMKRVEQTGQVQGQDTRIDLTYADGRVTGMARAPKPPDNAIEETTIDAKVPAGVIDDNALTVLVPAMPWTASSKFSVPVFASGLGELQTYTLTVAGTESVTVPAGTFQAYRVDVTGGQAPLTLYVSSDLPHRLLKVAPTGTPVELVRIR